MYCITYGGRLVECDGERMGMPFHMHTAACLKTACYKVSDV